MKAIGTDARESPLAGLKVLDFSRVLAGPFAGRMLCDLGAEVVKVEPPDGDVTRLWGRVVGGVPGYYHQQNAGKPRVARECERSAQYKTRLGHRMLHWVTLQPADKRKAAAALRSGSSLRYKRSRRHSVDRTTHGST